MEQGSRSQESAFDARRSFGRHAETQSKSFLSRFAAIPKESAE